MESRKKLVCKTLILLLLFAAVFPLLYIYVDRDAAKYARYQLSRALVEAVNKTSNLDDYMIVACIALGLYSLGRKNKDQFQKCIFPPLAALFAGILTHLVKWTLGRWRPKAYFVNDTFGFQFLGPIKAGLNKYFGVHTAFCDNYPFTGMGILLSFPSGHSSSMMAIMTAIAILQPKFRWPCFIVAFLFGSARVITSAHYPSDVLGGLIVGYLAAHWLRYLLDKKDCLPGSLAKL